MRNLTDAEKKQLQKKINELRQHQRERFLMTPEERQELIRGEEWRSYIDVSKRLHIPFVLFFVLLFVLPTILLIIFFHLIGRVTGIRWAPYP